MPIQPATFLHDTNYLLRKLDSNLETLSNLRCYTLNGRANKKAAQNVRPFQIILRRDHAAAVTARLVITPHRCAR